MDQNLKRLLYRATHRGMKETDRLVGGFAESHLTELSPDQITAFDHLLDENDNDLLDWIMERAPAPARVDHKLMSRLIDFKNLL